MVCRRSHGHRWLPPGDAARMIPQPTFTENGTDPGCCGELCKSLHGVPPKILQGIMGHKKLESTLLYEQKVASHRPQDARSPQGACREKGAGAIARPGGNGGDVGRTRFHPESESPPRHRTALQPRPLYPLAFRGVTVVTFDVTPPLPSIAVNCRDTWLGRYNEPPGFWAHVFQGLILSPAPVDCHSCGICCHMPMGFLCYTPLERRGNHAPGAVADIATTVANPFNELIESSGIRFLRRFARNRHQ